VFFSFFDPLVDSLIKTKKVGLAPKPYDLLWPVNKRLGPYAPAPQGKVVELVGKPRVNGSHMLSFPASRAFFFLF
jgi:hypothetical protein